MKRTVPVLFLITILTAACGIKPDLPSQIKSTQAPGSYSLEHTWNIESVTDMLIHRNTEILSVIQGDTLLSIFPTYPREDENPLGREFFKGLIRPLCLADGRDFGERLWVFDGEGDFLKGYDGSVFNDTLEVQVEYHDPVWDEVVALAADDEGRVFVADRGLNKVFRYRVEGSAVEPELEPDGEILWVAQEVDAFVRDLVYTTGKLILLDDNSLTVQFLDPAGEEAPTMRPITLASVNPTVMTADANHVFVIDRGDSAASVWQVDWNLTHDAWQRVNEDEAELVLEGPEALALNRGKVYVADGTLGKVIDYELAQP